MTDSTSRREFLRWAGTYSMLGTAAPLALQLTASSAAAATTGDYKAVVCLFLQGGQDSNNLVLATDADSWGRYTSARNTGQDPINLMPVGAAPIMVPPGTRKNKPNMWGGVLPIVPRTPQAVPAGTNASQRTFALHPHLAPLVPMFEQNRLAVLANVGTLLQPTTKAQYDGRSVPIPPQLFSHNDQQSSWQSGAVDGAQTGWGGRIGDMLSTLNNAPIFTTISAAGNAVFLSGDRIGQYQVNVDGPPAVSINGRTGSLFGSTAGAAALNSIIQDLSGTSNFANDHADVVRRSISASVTLNAAVGGAASQAIPTPPTFIDPVEGYQDVNPWLPQLYTVAQLIAAAPSLGLQRQVFFVRVDAHDTHDNQNPREAVNLARLAQAMTYFDQVLSNIGGKDMRSNVTTFTASDFSRSFTSNGTGTDHAWGGHHFIMGGAVKGGDMYGQYPTLGQDKGAFYNPDFSGNNMIPTTSVDQYGATIARWLGVSDDQARTIFPHLGNFAQPYLGFL